VAAIDPEWSRSMKARANIESIVDQFLDYHLDLMLHEHNLKQ
jgi:hypothetical protein